MKILGLGFHFRGPQPPYSGKRIFIVRGFKSIILIEVSVSTRRPRPSILSALRNLPTKGPDPRESLVSYSHFGKITYLLLHQ
jgi:hypothetical protein